MKLLNIILLIPAFVNGQIIYKGSISDFNTKKQIPYATIALIRENVATNADQHGFFSLSSTHNTSDSLLISCVGYNLKQIPISGSGYYDIVLERKVTQLSELYLISKTNWTTEKLNIESECGNVGMTTMGSHTQIAKYFTVPSINAFLTEIEICNRKMFNSRKAIFRIRIYDIDSLTKAPSKDLCDHIIEIKSNKKTIIVNLSEYNIFIPNKCFFVAIEWLKIPYNENKFKVTDAKGRKQNMITFNPSIGGHQSEYSNPNKSNTLHQVWQLNYQNRWVAITPFDNISIVATVKY